MKVFVSLFVGKPLNILAVVMIFLVAFLIGQFTAIGTGRQSRWLFIVMIAWALYALWEWIVQVRTPGANIRVDLLLIWPVLAVLTAWSIYRSFR